MGHERKVRAMLAEATKQLQERNAMDAHLWVSLSDAGVDPGSLVDAVDARRKKGE